MSTLILKDGRRVMVAKDEHFMELIEQELGMDALDYLKDMLDDLDGSDRALFLSDPMKYCPFQGECDKVFETQRHYTDILQSVQEEIAAWPMAKLTKAQLMDKRDALYERIGKEL